jgi:hypothetical protein
VVAGRGGASADSRLLNQRAFIRVLRPRFSTLGDESIKNKA